RGFKSIPFASSLFAANGYAAARLSDTSADQSGKKTSWLGSCAFRRRGLNRIRRPEPLHAPLPEARRGASRPLFSGLPAQTARTFKTRHSFVRQHSPSMTLAVLGENRMTIRKTFAPRSLLLLLFVSSLVVTIPVSADTTSTKDRTITKLADNIYEIRHPDAPDTFPQGNTTVIIGDKSVLVVDSCLLPSSAQADIDQIRKWTKKPVTFLVNTHWHFDHTLGNQTYAQAFPGIQIIAQKNTQKIIADFNPGAVARYPTREARFKKILAENKAADGHTLSDAERKDYKHAIVGLAPVVAEMKTTTQLVPNVSFDRELNIDLGNRPVEIRFIGRGNTAGDTIVYLPKEKILMAGDL